MPPGMSILILMVYRGIEPERAESSCGAFRSEHAERAQDGRFATGKAANPPSQQITYYATWGSNPKGLKLYPGDA